MEGGGQEREGLPACPAASSSPRLAGALDISSCPQSRKDVLYAKAREAFGSTGTTAAYYRFMRPYLGETLPCVRQPVPRSPPPLSPHHCPAPRRCPRGGAAASGPGERLHGHRHVHQSEPPCAAGGPWGLPAQGRPKHPKVRGMQTA